MYEYKVIPAPLRTLKVKGLKTPAERFAYLLEGAVNAEAGEGWEFLRAETLPCEERKGLTGTAKSFQSVLVFRRAADFGDQGHGDATGVEEDFADSAHTDDADNEPQHTDTDERPAPSSDNSARAARLSLVATRHEPDTRAPRAGQPTPQHTARQEPVLRTGSAPHGAASERPEPVLRARDEDGNQA